MDWYLPSDQEVWLWAGPSVFEGVPESNYVLEVCGIQPIAVWGACCLDLVCQVGTQAQCEEWHGSWLGDGTTCVPNPCESVPVEVMSWGRIKHGFR